RQKTEGTTLDLKAGGGGEGERGRRNWKEDRRSRIEHRKAKPYSILNPRSSFLEPFVAARRAGPMVSASAASRQHDLGRAGDWQCHGALRLAACDGSLSEFRLASGRRRPGAGSVRQPG